MRLTVERDVLHRGLARVASVVERRTTIPILGHLVVRADEHGLGLTATDLDILASDHLDASVMEAGATTVPATRLADLVRNWPAGGEIEMRQDGAQLVVRCGRSRVSLPTLPPGDFPVIPDPGPEAAGGPVDPKAVARLLAKTCFAVSADETRYYLGGVYLHVLEIGGEKVLRAVATDGASLAAADMPCPAGFEGWPGVIVPRKTAEELMRGLEGAGEAVLTATPERIAASLDRARLVSKLIDGSFPDYQRVIPADDAGDGARIDTVLIAGAMKRLLGVADDKARSLRLHLTGDGLTITSRSQTDGTTITEEVDAEFAGEPLELGVNAKKLADALGHLDGDFADLRLSPGAPILIRDSADKRLLLLVMPHR